METTPLSPLLSTRLARLSQEIHGTLEEVRRHIQELEKVEECVQLAQEQASADFAALLKEALNRSFSPGARPSRPTSG